MRLQLAVILLVTAVAYLCLNKNDDTKPAQASNNILDILASTTVQRKDQPPIADMHAIYRSLAHPDFADAIFYNLPIDEWSTATTQSLVSALSSSNLFTLNAASCGPEFCLAQVTTSADQYDDAKDQFSAIIKGTDLGEGASLQSANLRQYGTSTIQLYVSRVAKGMLTDDQLPTAIDSTAPAAPTE